MMQITARTTGDHTVLELNGRFILGADLLELRNAVFDAAGRHPTKILLNLADVTYADSCGIGELVNMYKHVQSRGGRLVLTNLPRRIRILLDIAKLMPVFEVSDGEQASTTNTSQPVSWHPSCQ
jgi:anti-sigma B factor antagonist